MKLKILSDTHMFHMQEPLDKVDILIHCGDATNSKNLLVNEMEFKEFFAWWEAYPAEYKIFVPGNHDMFCESPKFNRFVKSLNQEKFKFLIDNVSNVEGVSFYGTPFTPRFNDWAFNASRNKIHKHYSPISQGVDIVISHGPPKFILDSTQKKVVEEDGDVKSYIEQVGCMSLLRVIEQSIKKPKHVFFGHIHGNSLFENNGTLIRRDIQYHNCSQVIDGGFSKGLFYKGKVLEI